MGFAISVGVSNASGLSATASAAINVTQPVVGLSLVLAFADGATLGFDQADAVDVGDYVGLFVRQRCLMRRHGAWAVFFRPDADGSRQEVVVEYGSFYDLSKVGTKAASGANPLVAGGYTPAHITSPYTATISRDGEIVATISVPRHWWSSRWRWQSAARPIIRGYDDIVAMRAILPLDLRFAYNARPPSAPVVWAGPMGTASLTVNMNTTGDRQEIGFLTDHQTCYLLTGDANALTTIMAQAEAAGTMPFWKRNVATAGPIDAKVYPYLTQASDAYSGAYSRTLPYPAPATADPTFFTVTPSHMPAVSLVPWLLTDDPFHLEGCQMAAQRAMMQTNYSNVQHSLPGEVTIAQERSTAWGLRDLARMAGLAPEAPPPWLLPRSAWQACVADNLAFFADQMSPAPKFAVGHPAALARPPIRWTPGDGGGYMSGFQLDYLMVVIGWLRWSGLFLDWDDVVAWLAVPRVAMISEGSGWDRRYPIPYANGKTCPLTAPTTWADVWAWYQSTLAANPPVGEWPPDALAPYGTSKNLGYLAACRAALAAFKLAGIAEADTPYDWLAPQLPALMAASPNYYNYRWAVQ